MKTGKICFICYSITFFLSLLLLSSVNSFEYLPNWKNNSKEKDLEDKVLLESEIISITKDNYTDKTLYLIRQDDETFLYIDNTKINNIYGDKLKYFTSPLVDYNNEYYFCSSLQNMVRINSAKQLDEIANKKEFDDLSEFELKCFYHRNESVITVTYLNTKYVDVYDLKTSNWRIYYQRNFLFTAEGTIIDATAKGVEYKSQFLLALFYINNANYTFHLYRYYWEFELGSAEAQVTDFENIIFYPRILITFGFDNKTVQGSVFTYKPREMNSYNFYHLNIGSNTVENEYGNSNLRIFREAEIYDAYFIENSPILVYNMRKIEKKGEYFFYSGAVDIESLVILYNIKMNDYNMIFYDQGYLYQNTGFLRYFKNGKQVEICPFIYKESENLCQFYVDYSYQYFTIDIDSSSKLNENKITNECNYIRMSQYCIKECPIGYGKGYDNSCTICSENYKSYYNFGTKECTYTPNETEHNENGIYYNCHSVNLKYFDNGCYENCSEIYGQTDPKNENECITCESLNKTFSNGICDDSCQGNGINIIKIEVNDYEYSFCQSCLELDKYYYNFSCYKKCPLERQVSDDNNVCYFCNETDVKYYQNGTCVFECSVGYSQNESDFYCLYCKDIDKYYQSKNCVENCSEGYGIDEENRLCEFCQSNTNGYIYYYKNECLSECPSGGYGINKDNLFCEYCKKNTNGNIYYYNYTCVDKCLPGYGINKDNNYCEFCLNKTDGNFLYYKNECVSECPPGYGINEDYYCEFCNDTNNTIYFYKNECVSECPLGYGINETNNFCESCQDNLNISDYYLYYNYSCVSSCPEGYGINKNYICEFCLNNTDNNIYLYNNHCVSECPPGYGINDKTKYCELCLDLEDKNYYYNNHCLSECPPGGYGITDETNKFCEYCYNNTNNKTFYYNNLCLSECPSDEFAWNESRKICDNCPEKGEYVKEGKCEVTCGTYVKDKEKPYKCVACNTTENHYFFEYECVKECPKYTVKESDYCRICYDKFQEGKCVDKCDFGYIESKANTSHNIEVDICTPCGNNTWFDGTQCVENCSESQFTSIGHYCKLCFCGFSKSIKCNKDIDQCISCKNDPYIFGDNCEFFTEKSNKEKMFYINNLGPIISTKKAIFKYTLEDSDRFKNNKNYKLKWSVFVDDCKINEMKNFATGMNEEIFIINSGVLKPKVNNKVSLELNITDETDEVFNFKDEVNISIQSLGEESNLYIIYSNDINKVMDNSFKINRDSLNEFEQYQFYYKILIKDEHNEIIAIKQKTDLDSLLDKRNATLSILFPIFKEYIFEFSNDREEKHIIKGSISYENSNIKYSLEDILNSSNILEEYKGVEKIYLIMKYLDINNKEIFTDNIYDLLFEFIKDKLDKVARMNGAYKDEELTKNEDDSIRFYLNYYEPRTIFSLLNKLLLHQNINIPDKYFAFLFDAFEDFFNTLIKNNNSEKIDNSNILSFFRTFDHLLDIYIKKEKNENITELKENAFNILNQLSEYLVNEIYPGETIRIIGKRISFFLSNLGKYQNNLAYSSIKNISENIKYNDFNTFSFDDYYLNQEKCDNEGNTLLCINNNNYNNIKSKKEEDISLIFYSINTNINNNNQNKNEGNIFKIKFISNNPNSSYNNFFYDIEFPFVYMPTLVNGKQFLEVNNTEKNYSNIACVPKNHLFNEEFYCLTYFHYEKDIIKCSCNVQDEITYVSDYEIAEFYKKIQTKSVFKQYNIKNKISMFGLFILLLFLLIPNFFYLIYDIKNDIKNVDYKYLSLNEKIKQKYNEVKVLVNSSVLSFSFYLFKFKYPYLSPLRKSNFKNPKYIKHFIITLSLFSGIIVSLILFRFYIPFKERKDIIDKRDITNPNYDVVDKTVIFKYLNLSVIFSIFGAIITRLFVYLFGIILSYNKDELKYWKEMKTMFSNYINTYIKGEVLLGETWRKIRTRMIAYINICGGYIINKKIKKKNKNLENYIRISRVFNEESKNPLLPLSECDEEMIELNNTKNKLGKDNSSSHSNKRKSKLNIKNNRFNIGAINDSLDESIISNFKIIKEDSFQLYSIKMKINKAITKSKKYERIKNKYILPRGHQDILELESNSENASFCGRYFTDLEIEYEYNLSYYPIKQYINESLKKYQTKTGKSSNISSINYNPEGFCLLIFINFVLAFLLCLLIFIIFYYVKLFLNEFGHFIIKIWIGTSIIIFLVIHPILYFIKNIISSFLLFKCYHLKKKMFFRFLFYLFVDKTMIYMFKTRNFITKYKIEFNY